MLTELSKNGIVLLTYIFNGIIRMSYWTKQFKSSQIITIANLGMIMDRKLTWKHHVVKKRKQVDLTIKQMNWLLGRKSKLAVENKILIYKAIIIPIWTYGLELWGCANKSNTSIIQRSQSKILRMIVDAPWYVSNATLYADLGISSVQDVI
jgi:hypothetical protein